ncbi:MAG: hypothetical protein WC584_02295 [Candidatus Pacearchaeota archaeon]
MKKGKVLLVVILFCLFVNSLGFVFADDLMALQGNVQQSGVNLASGNLQVVIYDAYAGGNIIYNSSSDFVGNVTAGKYDVMLGNGTQKLNLEYRRIYYLELYVSGGSGYEIFTFNGKTRQVFQSGVGKINGTAINPSQINGTHLAENISLSGNLSIVGNFSAERGFFSWLGTLTNRAYNLFAEQVNVNGTANFSGTLLVNNINASQWLFNQSVGRGDFYFTNYSGAFISNISIYSFGNFSLQQFNDAFNQNLSLRNFGNFSKQDFQTAFSNNLSVYSFSNFNKTEFQDAFMANVTNSDIKVNTLNITTALRVGSTSLYATTSGINITGETNFDGRWADGGITISGGDIWAQVLYVYNITSVGVSNLYINGSEMPSLNNTWDLGNATHNWRTAYFSNDIYVAGASVKTWAFNQSIGRGDFYFTNFSNSFGKNFTDSFKLNFTDSFKLNFTDSFDSNLSTRSFGNFSFTDFQTSFGKNFTDSFKLNFTDSFNSNVSAFNKTLPWNQSSTNIFPNSLGFSVGIGTSTPSHLLTIANSATALNVSGNLYVNSSSVGIGTSTPQYPLEVSGSAGTANTNLLSLNNNGAGDLTASSLVFKLGGTQYGFIKGIYVAATGGGRLDLASTGTSPQLSIITNGNIGIGTSTPAYLLEIKNNATSLNVSGNLYANSSSVGIGTATPAVKLDVSQTTASGYNEYIRLTNPTALGDAKVSINWVNTAPTPPANMSRIWSQVGSSFIAAQFGIDVADSNKVLQNRLLIDVNGNVGIGTTSPSALLQLNGTGRLLDIANNSNSMFFVNSSGYVGIADVKSPIALNVSGNLYVNNTFTGIGISTSKYLLEIANSATALNVSGNLYANTSTTWTTGSVGIGTTSPNALLNLKGTLSSALTGTVAVTNLLTTVTGTLTVFTSELAVGDSIKMGTEIFTVSVITSDTSLTLDSAYQGATDSGLTAYRDPTLFAIDNGDAVNKLTITRSGKVGMGTTSPGALLQLNGTGRLLDIANNSNSMLFVNSSGYVGIADVKSPISLNVSGNLYVNNTFTGINSFKSLYLFEVGNNVKAMNVSGLLYVNSTSVGIGTSTPSHTLNVVGDANITGTTNVEYLKINPDDSATSLLVRADVYGAGAFIIDGVTGGDNRSLILFQTNDNTFPLRKIFAIQSDADTGAGGPFDIFSVGSAGNIIINNNSQSTADFKIQGQTLKALLFADVSAGRIGIGTLAPTHELNVNGNTNLSGTLWAGNNTLYVSTSNVGIGTTSPSALLQINGTGRLLDIANNSNSMFFVNSSGYVGIADVKSPIALNVSGNLFVNGTSVGIGVSKPRGMLEIYQGASTSNSNSIGLNISTINAGGAATAYGIYSYSEVSTGFGSKSIAGYFESKEVAADQTSYGIIANASGASTGSTAYGIYASASGAATNWAGFFVGDVNITGNLLSSHIGFGSLTSSGVYEFEDGSVCIGDGGCTASATDGRLAAAGTIAAGTTTTQAYNTFGVGAPEHTAAGEITDADDLYVSDDIESDGTGWFAGGAVTGDIAESIQTKNSREAVICPKGIDSSYPNDNCYLNKSYKEELEYGDVVCIDIINRNVIIKCNFANSRFVVGIVSNTTTILMNDKLGGYPIGLAGIVYAKVTNENGNIEPGDLLVSASKPGYAMKNNAPAPGTVVGKAYDSCDKKECVISVFVTLS